MNRKFTERIEYKGTRFEQKVGIEFDQENWNELKAKGIMDESKNTLANDWETTFSLDKWGIKYLKHMYSPSLDRLRSCTFSEFYGIGIVD
jgi:hypothetical protein